jgi:hypothetical protein
MCKCADLKYLILISKNIRALVAIFLAASFWLLAVSFSRFKINIRAFVAIFFATSFWLLAPSYSRFKKKIIRAFVAIFFSCKLLAIGC